MPKAKRLKVYRTPIGFHDAYVAAPSQKEALKAWGSDADLFARGAAEVVTNPALTREPLEKPGVVVKRLRGTNDEQIAAASEEKTRRTRKAGPAPVAKPKAPRPDRRAFDEAEAALARAEERLRAGEGELQQRIIALERQRTELREREGATIDRLRDRRDAARADYEAAMERWRSG